MNDGESVLGVNERSLPCLNFLRYFICGDAGALDTHYQTLYSLMCRFPSENPPNSCNPLQILPRGLHFPPSPVPSSIGLNQIEFSLDNVRTVGLSAWIFFSRSPDAPLASTFKTLYSFSQVTPTRLTDFHPHSVLSSRAFRLSVPGRRELRTRTCNRLGCLLHALWSL